MPLRSDELRKAELARLQRGIIPTHETVGQYVTGWLDTVEVGPGTWPRYRQHVTERILPAFGDVALDRAACKKRVIAAGDEWPLRDSEVAA